MAEGSREESQHTLAGLLSRLQGAEIGEKRAEELEQRLNTAFSKHIRQLKAYCRRELRGFSAERIEELTQDVLLEAWNKLPSYRAESRFRAFLWAIAARKCANARRKRQDCLLDDGLFEVPSEGRSALQALSDQERNEMLEETMRSVLDEREQEVVYLRWVLDYPYEDIEALLAISAHELRATLQRCKNRMKKEIPRWLAANNHGSSFLTSRDP